ncbi:MAG: ribonuclease Z [Bacteroidales bacterium]|nr:ribonuclease Z [Bacteroidales bacterium]
MDTMKVHILGCGSALPTTRHSLSAQVLELSGKLFLIDCGEAAQLQFRRTRLNFNRISDIFISHLHGDHCFGLPGLISTLSLLGRTAPLRIHAHPDLERLLRPQLGYFCRELGFEVVFQPFSPHSHELIYEDRGLRVYSLPLIHRVPSTGFLFKERPGSAHIVREMTDFYKIPLRELPAIKAGADYVTPEGEVIPHERLTRPAAPPRSYAYCSDTAYNEALIPMIAGVDLLYHEATFARSEEDWAATTQHSTAAQAGKIAAGAGAGRLLIGHFSARYEDENLLLREAQAVFPQTMLANEGMTVEI